MSAKHDLSSSEDEVVGPVPDAVDGNKNGSSGEGAKVRKVRRVRNEKLHLANLPNFEPYTRSYLHRAPITVIAVQPIGSIGSGSDSGFVVSGSADGFVKFWKKSTQEQGDIEFVKQYLAHADSPVLDAVFSTDGKYVATVSSDRTAKVFDVTNFDMINIVDFKFDPRTICWIQRPGRHDENIIAVAEKESTRIHLFDPLYNDADAGSTDNATGPFKVLAAIHRHPVVLIKYNPVYDCVVSTDEAGMIEYWQPRDQYQKPASVFELKSDTNLYEFRKAKTRPVSLAISANGKRFAVITSDSKIVVFNFQTGKKIREYDESLQAQLEMQSGGTAVFTPDEVEFGRRMATDRHLAENQSLFGQQNVIFDHSGHYLLYPTLLGIKVVELASNTCRLLLGKEEGIRFLGLASYQGQPRRKNIMTVEMAASDNALISDSKEKDPIIFATALDKNRFYLFSRFDGSVASIKSQRDAFNETVDDDKDQSTNKSSHTSKAQNMAIAGVESVTLHTSLGDIKIALFPEHAPLAVENFVMHCKNGYYDNIIFHRVIKNFMIQTGDPDGQGTGGTSIWGGHFRDEFTPHLRHDRPFTVSMANAGKNTNGSQFFITTAKTPWLDDKHSIFGRVVSGTDTVRSIESLSTNRRDRPDDPPAILSTTVHMSK